MHHAYQDTENLYLVMDYLSGGDLRYHLIKRSTFTENETSIIISIFRIHNSMYISSSRVYPY